MATISALRLALRGSSKEVLNGLHSKDTSLSTYSRYQTVIAKWFEHAPKRLGSNSIGCFDNVIKKLPATLLASVTPETASQSVKKFAAFISLGANL